MNEGRVISFAPKARPLSGEVTLTSDDLCLANGKVHHGPQWAFTGHAKVDGEDALVPIHVGIVAEIDDEPESMGWLDRQDDGLAGKFVVGTDWEAVIRNAAFGAVTWLIDIEFATDPEGDIQGLRVGMRRKQAAHD